MPADPHKTFVIFKQRVSLRQIEILASLTHTELITQTADDFNVSAAALSRACGRFESHFSFAIFAKRRKGIGFTEKGAELLEDIRLLSGSVKHFIRWWSVTLPIRLLSKAHPDFALCFGAAPRSTVAWTANASGDHPCTPAAARWGSAKSRHNPTAVYDVCAGIRPRSASAVWNVGLGRAIASDHAQNRPPLSYPLIYCGRVRNFRRPGSQWRMVGN